MSLLLLFRPKKVNVVVVVGPGRMTIGFTAPTVTTAVTAPHITSSYSAPKVTTTYSEN